MPKQQQQQQQPRLQPQQQQQHQHRQRNITRANWIAQQRQHCVKCVQIT